MKRVLPVSLAVVVLGMSVGCSKKKSDDKKNTAPDTTAPAAPTTPTIDTTVLMQGSLNLLGASAGSLVDTGYNIYCVTFEDTPKACKADVDATGAFNKACEGFAGQAFGCFLRQNNKTLGDIVFDTGAASKDGSLTTAGGALKFDLNFDPDTGMATAKVDMTTSTALAAEKIEQVKAALGVSTTTVPDLSGTWNLACVGYEDAEGNRVAGCPQGDGPKDGMTIHFHDFTTAGQRKTALWESQTKMNTCLGSALDETAPQFQIKIGTSSVDMSQAFDSLDKFKTAMVDGSNSVMGKLAALDSSVVAALADATSKNWDAERCARMEETAQQLNPATYFGTEGNCQVVGMPVEEKKVWDPGMGQEVTRYEPKWLTQWSEVEGVESAGGQLISASEEATLIKSNTSTCFNPNVGPVDGHPEYYPCPPHLYQTWNNGQLQEDKTTPTFPNTWIYWEPKAGVQAPVNFLCKAMHDATQVQFFPLKQPTGSESYFAASRDDVIATMTANQGNMGKMDTSCQKTENYMNTGKTIYQAQEREMARAIFDLMRQDSKDGGDGYDMCAHYTGSALDKATFNYNTSCVNAADNTKTAICWNNWWAQELSVRWKLDGTDIESTGAPIATGQFPVEMAQTLCPTTYGNWDKYFDGDDDGIGDVAGDNWDLKGKAAKEACRTEFLNGTKLNRMDKVWATVFAERNWPASAVLTCKGNDSTKNTIKAIAANSCVPEVRLEMRCDGGSCVETVECSGSEDGSCKDANGVFKGRLPGRFELFDMKPRLGGAFDLSSLTVDVWNKWEEGKSVLCKHVNSNFLQGKLVSDSAFDARLLFNEKEYCEGQEVKEEDRKKQPAMYLKMTRQ